MDPPPRMCIGKMVEGSSCNDVDVDGDGAVVVSLFIAVVVVVVVSHFVDMDDRSQDR